MTIPATNPPAPEFKPHGPIMWVPDWNKAQAAIDLRVPRSGIPELDAMIRESRRLDMATAAMCALVTGVGDNDYSEAIVASSAFSQADALLAASEKEERK